MDNNKIDDILEAREKRAELIEFLAGSYRRPVLVIKANYPGTDKNNETAVRIVEIVEKDIAELLKDKTACLRLINSDGPASIIVFTEDCIKIKKKCIEYEENSILGRCVDIDVYDNKGLGIGRTQLGYPARKCFICGETAHICVRSRKHKAEEIIEFLNNKLKEYMEESHGKSI